MVMCNIYTLSPKQLSRCRGSYDLVEVVRVALQLDAMGPTPVLLGTMPNSYKSTVTNYYKHTHNVFWYRSIMFWFYRSSIPYLSDPSMLGFFVCPSGSWGLGGSSKGLAD